MLDVPLSTDEPQAGSNRIAADSIGTSRLATAPPGILTRLRTAAMQSVSRARDSTGMAGRLCAAVRGAAPGDSSGEQRSAITHRMVPHCWPNIYRAGMPHTADYCTSDDTAIDVLDTSQRSSMTVVPAKAEFPNVVAAPYRQRAVGRVERRRQICRLTFSVWARIISALPLEVRLSSIRPNTRGSPSMSRTIIWRPTFRCWM